MTFFVPFDIDTLYGYELSYLPERREYAHPACLQLDTV